MSRGERAGCAIWYGSAGCLIKVGVCCWSGPTNTAGWVGGTIPGSMLGVVGGSTPVTSSDQARDVGLSAKVTYPVCDGGGK
jgi:hypothetical protein